MTPDPTDALRLYSEDERFPNTRVGVSCSERSGRTMGCRWIRTSRRVRAARRRSQPSSTNRLELYPGMSIVSSAPDVLGDRAWFRWSATLGIGESFTGVDFAADGRIARLTGFYEP
jgi:hypothetical protein